VEEPALQPGHDSTNIESASRETVERNQHADRLKEVTNIVPKHVGSVATADLRINATKYTSKKKYEISGNPPLPTNLKTPTPREEPMNKIDWATNSKRAQENALAKTRR
jgi:hypothetical protein